MLCPNCRLRMEMDVVDEQNIFHCSNCGSTFFEENGINRISLSSAKKLSSDLKAAFISIEAKFCPKDSSQLVPMSAGENIPADATLFRCPTCRGLFALPNDLVLFKKAQDVKIDYFKVWGIPLPSISSVVILSFLLFVAVLSFFTYSNIHQQNITNIQAQDLVTNLYVSSSNRYLFLSFKTRLSLKSKIIFNDLTTNKTLEKDISVEPSTFHSLTTADVNLEDEVLYQIILTDERGKEARMEVRKLEIK